MWGVCLPQYVLSAPVLAPVRRTYTQLPVPPDWRNIPSLMYLGSPVQAAVDESAEPGGGEYTPTFDTDIAHWPSPPHEQTGRPPPAHHCTQLGAFKRYCVTLALVG